MVSRFPVDDAELSALHARAFGNPPGEMTPWRARLERHALTWVGAFDGEQLVGFVQVCWDGGIHASEFYFGRCGFRPTEAGLLRLN